MIKNIDASRPCNTDLVDTRLLLEDYRALKAKINEIIDVINNNDDECLECVRLREMLDALIKPKLKSIQFRIDEICNEMNKYYFSHKEQQELAERLNEEGYEKYEAIEAVKHYCRQ